MNGEPLVSSHDEADLVIDGALFEERELLFGCPEDEIDYAYVAALIRCAYIRGVKDCYEKSGGPGELRVVFHDLGFEV